MSLFAGAVAHSPNHALPSWLCNELASNLSRTPEDRPDVFATDQVVLAKLDLGAFGAPGVHTDERGGVSVLAGEILPYRRGSAVSPPPDRARELEAFHESARLEDWSVLRESTGVFALAHVDPVEGRLTLASDKLGVRPIYIGQGDGYVVFSTALRVLESLEGLPDGMDLRGVTERLALGYPLADRTPYGNIRRILPAEVIVVTEQGTESHFYWNWDGESAGRGDDDSWAEDLFHRFESAVERRLRGDRTTVAALSGGLDSRCVVGALRARGATVHAFNFGLPGSQDRVFGREFARAVGAIYQERTHRPDDGGWAARLKRAWEESAARERAPAERPGLAWSGDGGSVGLGFVYMTREIVRLARARDWDGVIERYIQDQYARVPLRILQAEQRDRLAPVPAVGIRRELGRFECTDPARAFHLFLLFNDQRRHLDHHFENIDRYRLELQLPFLDSNFLDAIARADIDAGLGHRAYHDWLRFFQPEVTSVPWQTYPGHVPCPVPIPQGLDTQWNPRQLESLDRYLRTAIRRRAWKWCTGRGFPGWLLDRKMVLGALCADQLRLRDCSHLLKPAAAYCRYWYSGGKSAVLDSAGEDGSGTGGASGLVQRKAPSA